MLRKIKTIKEIYGKKVMGIKYTNVCDMCGKEQKALLTKFWFEDKRFENIGKKYRFSLTLNHDFQEVWGIKQPSFCEKCFLNLLEIAVEQTKECLERKKSNENNN